MAAAATMIAAVVLVVDGRGVMWEKVAGTTEKGKNGGTENG